MITKVEQLKDYAVVTIQGRIDTTNYNEFEKSISEVMNSGSLKILIDCSGLNYISSSGLRVFLITHKRMTATGGQLTLCSIQPAIKEIFDISGLTSFFVMVPDRSSVL